MTSASASPSVIAHDLHDHYDANLLEVFYRDFMVPNFGIFEDELEDLETWVNLLDPTKVSKNEGKFVFHVALLLDPADKKVWLPPPLHYSSYDFNLAF